jgi:hypothetical protein
MKRNVVIGLSALALVFVAWLWGHRSVGQKQASSANAWAGQIEITRHFQNHLAQ